MNVESVRLKAALVTGAACDRSSETPAQRGSWIARGWAFVLCPTVLLLSYVPVLNLFARGVLLLFIAWFMAMAVTRRRQLIVPGLFVVFFAWCTLALLVSGLAVDVDMALRRWVTVVSLGLVSWGVANAVVWSGSSRAWGWAFILSSALAYLSNYLPIDNFLVVEYETEVLGRFVGTLGNANAFGRAMVHAFFVGLGMLLIKPRGREATLVILAMGIFGLAVIESSSRTAMLGIAIGVICFYSCLRARDLLTPLNLIGLAGVVAGIVVVVLFYPKHFETAAHRMSIFFGFLGVETEVDNNERSIENRLVLAKRAVELAAEHPLGLGLDNLRTYIGTYAHSNFLEVLVSTGVLGLILYYAMHLRMIFEEVKRRPRYLPWLWFIVMALGSAVVMDFFNVSYYSKVMWVFLGILCGFSVIAHKQHSERTLQQH